MHQMKYFIALKTNLHPYCWGGEGYVGCMVEEMIEG